MQEHTFDSRRFLGNKENSAKIYAHSPRGIFYSPFTLKVRETERLMLFNVDGDPLYSVIELQCINESGQAAVLLYNKEGRVEVYHTRKAVLDDDVYQWGSNWTVIGETDIEYEFTISDRGINAWLRMKDQKKRECEFMVKELDPRKRFSSLLAPLGFEHDNPAFFPFMYLNRFSPTRAEGTEIRVVIDGQERQPSLIPVKINNERMYHTRYSDDPFIGIWNRNYRGPLSPVGAEMVENGKATVDDIELALLDHNGHYEIAGMAGDGGRHTIYFQFMPAIPDLVCLKDGVKVTGKFVGGVDDREAAMGGKYTVERAQDQVKMTVEPTKGWQPVPGKLWLTAFRWLSELDMSSREVGIDSKWILAKGGLHEFFYKKMR